MGSNSKGSSTSKEPTTIRAVLRRCLRRVLSIRGTKSPTSRNLPPGVLGGPPTAQSQTNVASAAAAAPYPYFDVETLLASVESGAIAAVKGSWLVGLHKRGGRLSRRQDLPPEAFWSAGELRRVALALGADFGVLFVALSYRWLTMEHPDPDGFHLGIVAAVAELYLNLRGEDASASQLSEAFQNHQLGLPEFALFWDFASLHQKLRTDAEAKLFRLGLQNSNVWYGHARTVVWMQSELPEGFAERMRASEPPLAETYEDSGWCYVEAAISAAIKPGFLRLDLAKRTERAISCSYGPAGNWWEGRDDTRLANVCARRRPPPPSPETVRRLLQTEKRFTNSSDVSKVADLYAAFFGKVTTVDALEFQGLEWGDADVVELCEVLPRFSALRTLNLSKNEIGPEGAKAIAEALKSGTAVLAMLVLDANRIGNDGAKAIAEALKVNVILTILRLDENNIGAEGAKAIAEALMVNAVVTELNLYRNNIGDNGAKAIAEVLKVNAVVTELGLGGNQIGHEGAKAIAEVLKVNAVVTELGLGGNQIGHEGAKAIAEVLKVNAVVTELHLNGNYIGDNGAKAIAEALKVNAVLTALKLEYNNIGPEGAIAIADALKVNAVLTVLWLKDNKIGDKGAKAIAEALKVNAVLTKLDLKYNSMGDAGEKEVREPVKDRSGFVLEL